jgi:hypothetical protein
MMSPEAVAPFLAHEDALVRRAANAYLWQAERLMPDLSRTYWDALEKVGLDKDRHLLRTFGDLRPSAGVFEACLAAVDSAPATVRGALERSLSRGPIASLREREPDVLRVLSPNAKLHEHVRRRLAMADVPAEEAWDELMTYGAGLNADHFGPDELLEDRLLEVLVRHRAFTASRIVPVLLAGNEDDERQTMAARLAGEVGEGPRLAELLLVKLAAEGDDLREAAEEALPRLATAELVADMEAAFPYASWDSKLSLAMVLGWMRRPQAEAALLRLAEPEEDETVLDYLADALAGMCSTSLAAIVERYRIDDPDLEQQAIQGNLAAAAMITGEALPEDLVGPWRERAAALEAADARRIPAWEDVFEYDPIRPAAFPPEPPYERIEPIKAPPKVGRNDPCPCGSGKKYKKCCLNKG